MLAHITGPQTLLQQTGYSLRDRCRAINELHPFPRMNCTLLR